MNTSLIHLDDTDGVDQSRLHPLLGWQITRAELSLHRKLVERLAPLALRPVDFFILVLIDSNHGINQRQIGDTLSLSPPNLVGVITRLIKKRLVRRVRGRHDRRVQHLHLTPAGHEHLVQAETAVVQLEQTLTAKIATRELSGLHKTLQQMVRG